MKRNPVTAFVTISSDAIRDALGAVPPMLSLAGATVRTTLGRAGSGSRHYFACPGCGRRVLLLYIAIRGGSPACRHCHHVSYAGQWLHRTPIEPYVAGIRRSSA
jgi:hypothetical protein